MQKKIIMLLYEKIIPFKFKGERTYVHGTDIYDRILSILEDYFEEYPSNITGSFHRLLSNDGIVRIYDDKERLDHEELYALFSVFVKDNYYNVAVLNKGTDIHASYAYDEAKVLENASLYGERITMSCKSDFTYIEQIVAMTKKLHLEIFPDANGRWLWTKFKIRKVIDPGLYPGGVLSLTAERNLHYRLTQCSITLDAQRIGSIWFSLLPSKETP